MNKELFTQSFAIFSRHARPRHCLHTILVQHEQHDLLVFPLTPTPPTCCFHLDLMISSFFAVLQFTHIGCFNRVQQYHFLLVWSVGRQNFLASGWLQFPEPGNSSFSNPARHKMASAKPEPAPSFTSQFQGHSQGGGTGPIPPPLRWKIK